MWQVEVDNLLLFLLKHLCKILTSEMCLDCLLVKNYWVYDVCGLVSGVFIIYNISWTDRIWAQMFCFNFVIFKELIDYFFNCPKFETLFDKQTKTSDLKNLVSWGYRIHQLHLCRWVRLPQQVSWIWLWGMQSTPSLSLLPDPLWPRVVRPDRVLSMGQIKLFDLLTVCKQIAGV